MARLWTRSLPGTALDHVSCYFQVRVWSTNSKEGTLRNYWKASASKSSQFELVRLLHVYAGTADRHIQLTSILLRWFCGSYSNLWPYCRVYRNCRRQPYQRWDLQTLESGDGFIGQWVTGSSIHSLFLHTSHTLLVYLVLQEVSFGCVCTRCYSTSPLAKRLYP